MESGNQGKGTGSIDSLARLNVPDRAAALLSSFSMTSRIVEVGPSFDPIAPKSQGWNSASIDHLSQEGLREKYAAQPGVNVDRIEPVDFIWRGGLLSDAVPADQHGSFDVFLASHVIEHTPDLVGFLDAAQTLLKLDGVVVLAIPDKRFCFDYFQPLTTTGQVLDAHTKRRERHSGERAFDHFAYAVTDGREESWKGRPSRGIRLLHPLSHAIENHTFYEEDPTYHDLHAWHFTPSSFELLMLELGAVGLTDWLVDQLTRTPRWEFFARLRRGALAEARSQSMEALNARRVALLKRSLLELREQIDWLLAAEPELRRDPVVMSPEWARADKAQSDAIFAGLRDRLLASEANSLEATRRLAALQNSTFWRATAPLRILINRIRRLRGEPPGVLSGR